MHLLIHSLAEYILIKDCEHHYVSFLLFFLINIFVVNLTLNRLSTKSAAAAITMIMMEPMTQSLL